MGLVLWIDQNTFATNLVEKVFKQNKLSFYGLNSVEDFAYLVEDLQPQVIVLDSETVERNLSRFQEQYLASPVMQNTPFISLGQDKGLDFIKNRLGHIARPFDPFQIPQKLDEILKTN